jgi:hypothetical protein
MAPDSRRISAMPGGRAHYAQLSTTLAGGAKTGRRGCLFIITTKLGCIL